MRKRIPATICEQADTRYTMWTSGHPLQCRCTHQIIFNHTPGCLEDRASVGVARQALCDLGESVRLLFKGVAGLLQDLDSMLGGPMGSLNRVHHRPQHRARNHDCVRRCRGCTDHRTDWSRRLADHCGAAQTRRRRATAAQTRRRRAIAKAWALRGSLLLLQLLLHLLPLLLVDLADQGFHSVDERL